MNKKIFVVFGTRPEVIKLAPVINEIKKHQRMQCVICVFRQHKEMLSQALNTFEIKSDFVFDIQVSDRTLFNPAVSFLSRLFALPKTGLALLKFFRILKKEKPELLIVQGDTSTAFLAAFVAFYLKIPVAHIEAGLRTYNKYEPFPEEINRHLISVLASFHFAPTESAKTNLLKENIKEDAIWVVGNTAIDTLLMMCEKQKSDSVKNNLLKFFQTKYDLELEDGKRTILVTAHRRESFGKGLEDICRALIEIASKRKDIKIVYPVHLNPNVNNTVRKLLKDIPNVFLCEPLEYSHFVFLMSRAYLILTDSGGIQEEAPSLGKPILVMRDTTERQEVISLGAGKLVGTDKDKIVAETLKLLEDITLYQEMATPRFLYGDGKASEKIVGVLRK